ncbi:MAG: RDD family protein [Candidatus Bathyarchaeia archaeon]
MVFCPRCGREVPEGAIYCIHCGSQVRTDLDGDLLGGTGFDRFMADGRVQWHWTSRLVAYIIDSIVVGAATFFAGWVLLFPRIIESLLRGSWSMWRGGFSLPFSMGVVQVIYFTLVEGGYGSSIGKQVMGLKVVDAEGSRPSFADALVRNISKVFWGLLVLDILIGFLSRADPQQKFTDQIAGTWVVGVAGGRFGPSTSRPKRVVGRRTVRRTGVGGDPLGWVNVGVTLIIIAVFFIVHPGLFSGIIRWLEGWGAAGPTMIPPDLLRPLAWFLAAMGVWNLVLAVVRVGSGYNRWNAVSDAYGGMFLLTFAFLLREYLSGLIPLKALLPALVIALGVVVLLASVTSYTLHDRL